MVHKSCSALGAAPGSAVGRREWRAPRPHKKPPDPKDSCFEGTRGARHSRVPRGVALSAGRALLVRRALSSPPGDRTVKEGLERLDALMNRLVEADQTGSGIDP